MAIVQLTEGKPGKIETSRRPVRRQSIQQPQRPDHRQERRHLFFRPSLRVLETIAVSNPNENKMVFDKELRELDHCGIYCWSAKDQTTVVEQVHGLPQRHGARSADEKWLYVNSSDMIPTHQPLLHLGEGGLFFNGPFGGDMPVGLTE